MGFIGVQPATVPLSVNDVPDLPATKITSGTFPALNGSNLTNLDAADLTGTLPAISGANLTNVGGGKTLQVREEKSTNQITLGQSYSDVVSLNFTPLESNYRTLRTGEYVEFTLQNNCEGEHKEQATNVTGIYGRELLCDFIHRNSKRKQTTKA